jgi:ABC-2 type transport system permease protein
MWIRLKAQIVKELLSVLRDPRSRAVLIGPPLMQLFIFAFAATLEVDDIAIAVLDRDAGSWSQELTQRVAVAGMVDRLIPINEPAEMARAIDRREAIAALRFPTDFSGDIENGETGTLQVVLDGRRANAAQITLGYLNRIAADLNAEIAPSGAGGPPTASDRHWFNPNIDYQWFIVPGLMAVLSMMSSLLVTSLSIARERELGTYEQLLVSPALPAEIIVGKTIPAMMIGLVLGTIMLLAGILVFRIPFTGSLVLLYGSLLLFILSVVGVGLMISSVSNTQQQAILGTFALTVPIVLTSGFATPVENMPVTLQWIAEANPLKHFLIVVQGSFLKALPPDAVWANSWPLLVIAAVTLTSAFFFVRWRLQ